MQPSINVHVHIVGYHYYLYYHDIRMLHFTIIIITLQETMVAGLLKMHRYAVNTPNPVR